MKIKVGTFNLFQYCAPPNSWYTRKEKFSKEQWLEKRAWIKQQIQNMDCDVIGFQEVFSQDDLKDLVTELGFDHFVTSDKPQSSKQNENIFTTTTVALASKYPITSQKEVRVHLPSLKKHFFQGHFKFSRLPIKVNIQIEDKHICFYICHLKSNRENEFEYIFNKSHTLDDKIASVTKALKDNYSNSLKQRLVEASSLFHDIKKEKKAKILMCDLNDREFSITIDALSNNKYHDSLKKESFILTDAYHQHKKKIYNPHPEQKEIQRPPTSYFIGKGNVLDFIFISNEFHKKNPNAIANVSNYEILDEHISSNHDGSILQSDHAQVVCELEFNKNL